MDRLAGEIKTLRREHRINSQEDLAELSGVSATTIKKLETGTIAETRPSTLMLLAQAFAKRFDGTVEQERVPGLYARLMRAAGFLPADLPAEPSVSREAFIEEMERRTGRHDLAVALSSVAWDFERIPESHRKILEAAILGLAAQTDEERAD